MENQQTRRPTTLEAAQELHRLYKIASFKVQAALPHMVEVATDWDELSDKQRAFFIQLAKEIRREQ